MKAKIEDLVGKTITKIDGLAEGRHCVDFYTSDGSLYQMYYDKGDGGEIELGWEFKSTLKNEPQAFIGSPVRLAEVLRGGHKLHAWKYTDRSPQPYCHYKWVDYHIATKTATLHIHWLATSRDKDHVGEIFFDKIY